MSNESPMEPAQQYRSGKRARDFSDSPAASPASHDAEYTESPDPQHSSVGARPSQPSMLSPFLAQMSVHTTPHSSAAASHKSAADGDAKYPRRRPTPPSTRCLLCACRHDGGPITGVNGSGDDGRWLADDGRLPVRTETRENGGMGAPRAHARSIASEQHRAVAADDWVSVAARG